MTRSDPGTAALLRLESRLRNLAAAQGMYTLGVADMTPAPVRAAVAASGGAWLAGFPRAVSVVCRLQDAVVDELPDHHRETVAARVYEFSIYKVVNPWLDQTAHLLAEEIQGSGFRAVPIPTSISVDAAGFQGAVSHKLAAHGAGIGWIGRSCLLVTPEVGPRVRLVTVLTDAPLAAGAPNDTGCGRCRLCVEACPAGAFTGRAFDPAEPVETRMDVRACQTYRAEAEKETGVPICGVCVAVCPHGRRPDHSGRDGDSTSA
ncbi:MAG: epoxyqueuosine reductase [Thermoleophilia bacterium]